MTQVISSTSHTHTHLPPSSPLDIPQGANVQTSKKPLPASAASAATYVRNGHLNLDTFSPVNQNGSFAFDRVIKSGVVQKRTRKTKKWKSVFLVLRPNLLSIYRNEKEDKLRKQLNPSELTAVAYLKDPKREHVFGLFSPSRNYHLEAASEKDASEWVELIRREARIEEEEEEMHLASPGGRNHAYHGYERHAMAKGHQLAHEDRLASSSPEPSDAHPRSTATKEGVRIPAVPSQTNPGTVDYSGNELGSYSDLSDAPDPTGFMGSSWSIPQADGREAPGATQATYSTSNGPPERINMVRNASQLSGLDTIQDDERVVWHGYLYCLKSKRGVRQWKMLWAVLRPKNLAFYKNEEEYAATLLIPMSSIINAVEIDPISRSKTHCMQIIAEDRSYRFCAIDEDALAKWLGALKSQLARKKEAERKRVATASSSSAPC